jgi:hypothetical protein
VIVTTRQIADGDEAAWHEHWKKIAERLHAAGEQVLALQRDLAKRTRRGIEGAACLS